MAEIIINTDEIEDMTVLMKLRAFLFSAELNEDGEEIHQEILRRTFEEEQSL